jgi:hypothetical protein
VLQALGDLPGARQAFKRALKIDEKALCPQHPNVARDVSNLGRVLQVSGLMLTLAAATAFFGTPSTLAMLRLMLAGVLFFLPGWLLARHHPKSR